MVAIIDIGSNTVRLCVYEIGAAGDICQTFKLKSVVGLAGYIDKKNHLTQEGISAACATLLAFRETMAGMEITGTYAFATAALRNIINTDDVVRAIKEETGFEVTVISGEEEALCNYMGAINHTPINDGLLVDIGGGSTELVLCKGGELEQVVSVDIGSLSMFSRYVARVLPSRAQAEKIRLEAVAKFRTFKSKPVSTICGVGGTMRTMRKLNNAVFGEPPENCVISAKNAKKILDLIDTDTHAMIHKILYINPERIHTITPGLIILNAIISKYDCRTVIVSESGVREGYLIRNILRREAGKPGTPPRAIPETE